MKSNNLKRCNFYDILAKYTLLLNNQELLSYVAKNAFQKTNKRKDDCNYTD